MFPTGTWSTPMLLSQVPIGVTVLQSQAVYKVMMTDLPDMYDFFVRTCANSSKMIIGIDFQESYAPVGHVDRIWMILCIAASKWLECRILDISNAFQISIIFDPSQHVYITLPPWYIEFFFQKWPDYDLPSLNMKELVLQCFWLLQGTKPASHQWHMLLSGKFKEPKMIQSNIDHGVFVWDYQGQQVYLSLATDDMVFASQDHTPFLYLKA